MKIKSSVYDYFSELMLYSGQYALFYIFMNLSDEGMLYFYDFGHVVLLLSLILQTFVATNLAHDIKLKALSTFIAPLIYTAVEIEGDLEWILNLGHFFFWIYTALLALLWYISSAAKQKNIKIFSEFLITFTNVSIFIFIYFFYDLKLSGESMLLAKTIDAHDLKEMLEIYNVNKGFAEFLNDPAHIFMIFGGAFLGLVISLGRVKILFLSEKINAILAQYMDAKIRDILVTEDEISQKKSLVILFCDIRNFSQISERNEPDKVVGSLNLYYDEWSKEVAKEGGVINKFIGDAVLVIFGLDKDEKNAPQKSVKVAKNMLSNMHEINIKLTNAALPRIENIGIGIHKGDVIIGSIGGSERRDYTVIGDNVNISQRIESLCKTFKKELIISDKIYALLDEKESAFFEYLGDENLKGKNDKISIYGLRKNDAAIS